MSTSRSRFIVMLSCLVVAGAPAITGAATVTTYTEEQAFLAATGPGLAHETFDAFESGTEITDQIPGLVFSSPIASEEGYFPIQAYATTTSSPPNALFGGAVLGSGTLDQVIVIDLVTGSRAFGFYLVAQAPSASDVSVRFDFSDESSQTFFVGDRDGSETTPEFFGVLADTPLFRVTFTSGREFGGEGGFEEFALDDLRFGLSPPECRGVPRDVEGTAGVDGSATDDTGIETVALDPASVNLTLLGVSFDGPTFVAFRIQQTDPQHDASGRVVVTDVDGQSCTVPASFRVLDAGAVDNETLCRTDGILVSASNPDVPAGTSVCSSSPFSGAEPPLPPGYEPSPPGDPFPCTVQTIDSPISGLTDIVLKKDGAFDPRLRLLFSRSADGGITFGPFRDVTDSVEEIDFVTPDPTRLGSKKQLWSVVKIACAIQAEICDGLDNDGDGQIDEGLPVGSAPVDADTDLFPLCPTLEEPRADCNDQRAFINPEATELCNGLDDDCDGTVDEGNPAGGEFCTVPGQTGICAEGLTTCEGGPLVCEPAALPGEVPETCDGQDNDCDGVVDEGRLEVLALRHTVARGGGQAPFIGLPVGVYDMSEGSCVRATCSLGVSWHCYPQIVTACEPVALAPTDASGQVGFDLPPGDYLVIGGDGTNKQLGVSAGDLGCLQTMHKLLQELIFRVKDTSELIFEGRRHEGSPGPVTIRPK